MDTHASFCPKHWPQVIRRVSRFWRVSFILTNQTNYQHIRLYATRHLGGLIQGSPQANAWTLRLLLTQLYDPAPDVCELAVEFLNEACDSKEILQLVVEMHPTMDHLGEIGHGLLLKYVRCSRDFFLFPVLIFKNRFMSTAVGFRFLYDAGYIHREMEDWFNVSVR